MRQLRSVFYCFIFSIREISGQAILGFWCLHCCIWIILILVVLSVQFFYSWLNTYLPNGWVLERTICVCDFKVAAVALQPFGHRFLFIFNGNTLLFVVWCFILTKCTFLKWNWIILLHRSIYGVLNFGNSILWCAWRAFFWFIYFLYVFVGMAFWMLCPIFRSSDQI